MSRLPTEIRIGYQDVKITLEESNLAENYGGYDSKEETIYLDKNAPKVELANTILHEILHAIWYNYGIKNIVKEKHEEPVCNILANGLTQVFKDSPELLKWLKEKLSV